MHFPGFGGLAIAVYLSAPYANPLALYGVGCAAQHAARRDPQHRNNPGNATARAMAALHVFADDALIITKGPRQVGHE